MTSPLSLDQEAERATNFLAGQTVLRVWRHRDEELGVEFESGLRLFVDAKTKLEVSITGTDEEPR